MVLPGFRGLAHQSLIQTQICLGWRYSLLAVARRSSRKSTRGRLVNVLRVACRRVARSTLVLFLAAWVVDKCFCPRATAGTDPVESLKSFSAFSSVDPSRLEAGEILGEPGWPMKFPTGISAETCFVVPVPAADAAQRLKFWDPSLRGTVKTLEFHTVSNACSAGDFLNLSLSPDNRSQRWLLEQSAAPLGRNFALNLTRAEASQLAQHVKTRPGPQSISAGWAEILLGRARLFQSQGFSGIPPYELGGQTVKPETQLQAMLRERPLVAQEFAPLLQDCGVLGEKRTGTAQPYYYWALYDANRRATLALGALYLLPVGEGYQLLDAEYYVSGTYYTFVTLYEVWPLQVQGKPGALIWRGDFFCAPPLAYTRGAERLAYGAFMLQELKKTIRSFQNDVQRPNAGPQ
jgi:hypothetical protein